MADRQHVDDCKTEGSAKTFTLASELLDRLKARKQASESAGPDGWIFASPFSAGRLPYSYTGVRQELTRAASAAALGHLSTHAFRHTDIRTTMNVYGDVVTDEMSKASNRVAALAFRANGARAERESS
jgi:integrase